MTPATVSLLAFSFSATTLGASHRTQHGDVTIVTHVNSQQYDWELTHHRHQHINYFCITAPDTYNHQVPTDWQWTFENNQFTAWAPNASLAIGSDHTAKFSARASRNGGALALAQASVRFADENTILLDGVWAPGHKPRTMVALVAGVLTVLALLHAWWITRWRSRN